MALSTLSGGSRVSREFWGQLARASPEDPLWVLASDDEITKVSRLDRAALEKLMKSEATSFESSFVLWKHTGLGMYERVISIDILCLDPYVQGELLGAELAPERLVHHRDAREGPGCHREELLVPAPVRQDLEKAAAVRAGRRHFLHRLMVRYI